MNKEEDKTTLNFPLEEDKNEFPEPKKLPNKKQVRLLFPYAERQEAKKLGAKWNAEVKFWYYPSINGDLPEELLKYKCNEIHVEYEDKEFWKQQLTSMKWDANKKVWLVNQADYEKFIKI